MTIAMAFRDFQSPKTHVCDSQMKLGFGRLKPSLLAKICLHKQYIIQYYIKELLYMNLCST